MKNSVKCSPNLLECPECNSKEIALKFEDRELVGIKCVGCGYHDKEKGWEKSWHDRHVADAEVMVRASIAKQSAH